MKGEAYVVVQGSRSYKHCSRVVCPLIFVYLGAIQPAGLGVVVYITFIVYQSDRIHPVPYFRRPLCVKIVTGISCKASRKLKETSIRNGVLDVIAGNFIYLPSDPSTTRARVPTSNLLVENCLGQ